MKDQQTIKYFCYALAIFIVIIVSYFVYRQVEHYKRQDDPVLLNLKDKFEKFFSGNGKEKYWTGELEPLNNRDIMKESIFTKERKVIL